MHWFTKHSSELIKPWESDNGSRKQAETTHAISPNQDFFISAAIGDIVDLTTGEISTYPDFAGVISDDIITLGWYSYTFDEVCKAYIEYFRSFIESSGLDFTETEIIFVQNTAGVMGEEEISAAPPKEKILEPQL